MTFCTNSSSRAVIFLTLTLKLLFEGQSHTLRLSIEPVENQKRFRKNSNGGILMHLGDAVLLIQVNLIIFEFYMRVFPTLLQIVTTVKLWMTFIMH